MFEKLVELIDINETEKPWYVGLLILVLFFIIIFLRVTNPGRAILDCIKNMFIT